MVMLDIKRAIYLYDFLVLQPRTLLLLSVYISQKQPPLPALVTYVLVAFVSGTNFRRI